MADRLAEIGYRVVEAPAPSAKRLRGKGKTDTLDAITAARSTMVMDIDSLRDRRAGEVQTALKVLTVAREQMNADRLRSINALTALLRTHDLGIDARRALTSSQIATVAAWRRRDEALGVATARADAVRHAKRIANLGIDLKANREQLTTLVAEHAPSLLEMTGIGAVTAAVVMTVWSHPGRIRSEAALAQIAGTCPIPASSGNTTRHRLNRGGDRQLNRAINTVVLTRMRMDPVTRTYVARAHRRGTDPPRDHPMPQALRHPPDPPDARRQQWRSRPQPRNLTGTWASWKTEAGPPTPGRAGRVATHEYVPLTPLLVGVETRMGSRSSQISVPVKRSTLSTVSAQASR